MKLLTFKSTTGPVLVSGGFFYQGFGEYEKVTYAMVNHDAVGVLNSGIGALSGYTIQAYPVIVSNNQVRVNIEKREVLASGVGVVTVAASGNVISNTFTTLAYGE